MKQVVALTPKETAEVFDSNHIALNTPALLKEACTMWPAYQKWSLEFFKENCAKIEVPISRYNSEPILKEKQKVRTKMSSYVDYVTSLREEQAPRDPMYAAGWHFMKTNPELMADIVIPSFFKNNLIDRVQSVMHFEWASLFIGHRFSQTPLHTDSFFVSTWLSCVRGSKTVRLIPGDAPGIRNGLDIFNPGVVADLSAANVSVYEAKIEQGDILFIPSGWWHQVINLDESIALSCNFVSLNNYLPFEQQIRGRILTPLVKLEKLTEELVGRNTEVPLTYSNDALAASKFVENERAFLGYLGQMRKTHEAVLSKCSAKEIACN